MAENHRSTKSRNPENEVLPDGQTPRIGRIAAVDEKGGIHVTFPGCGDSSLPARVTTSARERLHPSSPVGREVLLLFENNDPRKPVVIDTLYSLLDEITRESADHGEPDPPQEITIDPKQLIFNAEEEIVLRCGEASITLTRNGKIIIRGNYLLSRSSGAQRIKGSSIQIN